jgi:XTP/dITP diphosphohydrolase
MSTLARLVVATRNVHKIAELTRILMAAEGVGAGVELVSLPEFPDAPDPAETGCTFAENALIKARAVAAFTGLPAIADDSGLCVDALNGMPGVLSARWAGRHGDDDANLRLVLDQIADVPPGRRGARFICAAVLVAGGSVERVVEGRLEGRLATGPRGTNGFGYDPIFVPEGEERTTAEMAPEEKDAISHRGRAFRALAPIVAEVLVRP